MESQDFEVYEFDSFQMDVVGRRLLRGGQTIRLPVKDFDILLFLVSNRGLVVTKEELIAHVWPGQFIEENNLAVRISALRKVLGESRASTRYIQTVQGRGYRFVANVRSVDAAKSGQSKSTPADARGPLNSLAVVPFGLITADPGENYLGQGIADAIITKLGKIKQLRVPPTTAILRYSKSEVDLEEISQQFGVDAVLTGQIQKVGDVIRVTAQLAAARGWQVLWAEKFDESFTNIFAIEDKVSERVANTLVQNLSAGEQENLTRRYTNDAEAYRYYLEGRYFWSKRTEDGFKKGIKCFRQAIKFDPRFAPAYAGVALCYNLLFSYGLLPPSECIPESKEAASRALELDETVADAHVAFGHIKLMYDWDLPGAEEHLRRAAELDPNNPTAYHWLALYLKCLGRFDESLDKLRQALELDPLSLVIKAAVATTYFFARRYEMAIAKCQEVIELDPNFYMAHSILGMAYTHKGMYKEGIEALRKASAMEYDPDGLANLGFTYAVAGDRANAESVIAELKSLSEHRHLWSHHLAVVYSGLGEREQTFAFLERAFEERNLNMALLKVDPRFDNVCADSRFGNLLRRIGLIE